GIDGEQVESVSDLQTKIRKYEPGETVRVEVVDYDRGRRTVSVRLDEAEALQSASAAPEVAEEAPDPLGLVVEGISADARQALDIPNEVDGVVVTDMNRFGQFAQRWQRMSRSENPVIVSVNRTEVRSVADYRREIARVGPGDVVSLLVYDPIQKGTVPVSVPLPSTPR
ncbi:MAG: hypothetical protein P8125_10080, partial [Gemmatimonadota bacterium]